MTDNHMTEGETAAWRALERAVAAERERCAKICEAMVVGGRAWSEEQRAAGQALLAAAENIRTGVSP